MQTNKKIIIIGAGVNHDCIIGAHVHIAPGAVLSGGVAIGKCVISEQPQLSFRESKLRNV